MSRNLRLTSELELRAIAARRRGTLPSGVRVVGVANAGEHPRLDAVPYYQALVLRLRALDLPLPTPEYRFDALRKWRFDFAWPKAKLALEIDGGLWRRGGGAHSHPSAILRDMEKLNAAALARWCVLRHAPERIDRAVADVAAFFNPTPEAA